MQVKYSLLDPRLPRLLGCCDFSWKGTSAGANVRGKLIKPGGSSSPRTQRLLTARCGFPWRGRFTGLAFPSGWACPRVILPCLMHKRDFPTTPIYFSIPIPPLSPQCFSSNTVAKATERKPLYEQACYFLSLAHLGAGLPQAFGWC